MFFYILGDADRLRERIERELLAGNLVRLAQISSSLTSGLASLVRFVENSLNADTIMAGGDDVLFRVAASAYSSEALREASSRFHLETGCTISFGVGSEIVIAYLNLRRAKASGGGTVVDTGDASP